MSDIVQSSDSEQSAGIDSDGGISSPSRPSKSPRKSTKATPIIEPSRPFIQQSNFDAYFHHNSVKSQTSNNSFTALVPPLSLEEYSEAIASFVSSERCTDTRSAIFDEPMRSQVFDRMIWELRAGFNVLGYGYGSKRRFLNEFATERLAKVGHIVGANAFQPDFTFKTLLNCIERVPGFADATFATHPGLSGVEAQTRRVYDFFSQAKEHLFLVIHNIDATPLRGSRVKNCLGTLALHPRIHIIASVDHINSPLLWTTRECMARKPDPILNISQQEESNLSAPLPIGFAWLWHDMTTLEPYDFELQYTDHTTLSGIFADAHKGHGVAGPSAAGTREGALTESAVLHVLASVHQKAKKMFLMMGKRQLESMQLGGSQREGDGGEFQKHAIAYSTLFDLAKNDLIVSNDTAMRQALAEFRDHGIVNGSTETSGQAGGEVLWIPMRAERLKKVLDQIEPETSV